ncbi:MAG: Uma2 family endonuclease, partial [Stackebrandtia sp.]
MTMAVAFDDALHPPTGGWTVDDLDELPLDGVRRELIDGVLHVMPTPGRIHQTVAAYLTVALDLRCPDGYDVTQAVEVVFNRRNTCVPDVMVTSAAA